MEGPGKSVYFLLSGRFCCLGFSVFVFAVWAGAFFFWCLGGGPGPAQTAKKKQKNVPPAQTAKKQTRPRPFRACFF